MKLSTFPRKQIVLSLVVILVGTGSFACGRLSVMYKKEPLRIDEGPPISKQVQDILSNIQEPGSPAPQGNTNADEQTSQPSNTSEPGQKNQFVASKSGKKYYPIDCASAQRIKEENRVYFATPEEAEAAGLERTTTCAH